MATKGSAVPEGVIERLPAYLNCLMDLEEERVATVSSQRMSDLTGINAAEIRRDLVHFGSFGIKGVGYDVKSLAGRIQKILGSDKPHRIALVGAGNLGSAIAKYDGLRKHGFEIAAIFDKDPARIGKRLGATLIHHPKEIDQVIGHHGIYMAIVAVPPDAAQRTVDQLAAAGVKVILNYTSARVTAPDGVQVHNSDPVNELLYTLYYLRSRKQVPEG